MSWKVALFLAFVAMASGFEEENAVLVSSSNSSICDGIFTCADCETARICRPGNNGLYHEYQKISCPVVSPYCDFQTGSCCTSPDLICGEKDPFICLQDGKFPDKMCDVYHVCKGEDSFVFKCKKPFVFNPKTGFCDRVECGEFNCTIQGVKTSHSLYNDYYTYCVDNNPFLIDRCSGKYELNETSQLCEPICHEEGVQEDLSDCTKYFKCHKVWVNQTFAVMVKERMECPPETIFVPHEFLCVQGTCARPSKNINNLENSSCFQNLPKLCLVDDGRGLKKECIRLYLYTSRIPNCLEPVRKLMIKLLHK